MYMSAALVPGMFHVKPRRFAEESLSSGFGRRTSRQYMREFILAFDDGMLRCPPGEVSLVRSSPVEWCNRFVSFGLGYALSLSGVSSCPVGCGVSRDLVRMSRLR